MTVLENAARAHAVIDLSALRHNVRHLVATARPAEVMLAVKANAYGHGLLPIARAGIEAGATSLAVLEIPAGLILRDAGITVPLFAWLHGTETDFRAGIDAGIELGVSSVWQIDAIVAAQARRPALVHLKIDTGLSRNGATVEEWPELIQAALAAERAGTVRIRAAWSHLADASVDDDRVALKRFLDAVAVAERLGASFECRHLAASSAGIRMPEARFDFVRFGIAAYGISPFDDASGAELGLRPVMSLRAPLVAIETGRIGRIAAGYADGVQIPTSPDAAVFIGGVRRPVLHVDVDSMTVDLGELNVQHGEVATIFGEGAEGEPTAEEWAGWADTIGDEIVAGITPRVPRFTLG